MRKLSLLVLALVSCSEKEETKQEEGVEKEEAEIPLSLHPVAENQSYDNVVVFKSSTV